MVLLCDRTLEIQEYKRMIEKERTAQKLLGDPVHEPMTRQAMLDEAMETGQLLGETM
jgi:hypothetical protein